MTRVYLTATYMSVILEGLLWHRDVGAHGLSAGDRRPTRCGREETKEPPCPIPERGIRARMAIINHTSQQPQCATLTGNSLGGVACTIPHEYRTSKSGASQIVCTPSLK